MSTSLLYHGWGVRGYRQTAIVFEEGMIRFVIEQTPDTFRCCNCGSAEVMKSGQVSRRLRSLPIGGKPVWIELPIQRLWCLACGKTRQAEVAFADERRSYTHAFERYVLDLSQHMTIKDVACHLGVGWDMVKEIQKTRLQRRFGKPKLKHLSHLAIDEISIGRGHRYLTVVLDLDRGAVVFVGEGKALALNKPLATVYYMKEDLRQIWDQRDSAAAEVFLDDWIARARSSGIGMLMKFAETLTEHRRGILNYYLCPITTAALEGTNNKIKTMQRQAYGFRDQAFFKLKIFALHETHYALVG